MTTPASTLPTPSVSHQPVALTDALRQITSGRWTLAPAGPAWTPERETLLLDSALRGWPVGLIVLWQHPARRPIEVIDGQRRLALLHAALTGSRQWALTADGISRGHEQPAAFALGDLLETMRYLPARERLNAIGTPAAQLVTSEAEQAALRVTRYTLPTLTVTTGDEATARALARRLDSHA